MIPGSPRFSILPATESWAGPGNEANYMYLRANSCPMCVAFSRTSWHLIVFARSFLCLFPALQQSGKHYAGGIPQAIGRLLTLQTERPVECVTFT